MTITAPESALEHKSLGTKGGSIAPASGVLSAEDDTGVVECLVSITGVMDDVDDIIVPGAYTKTLARRTPKGVWSHDTKTWTARTEKVEEWMPGDPRLPTETRTGEPWPRAAGAMYVKCRFNLATSAGQDAYHNVRFFSETNECEWSIGYVVPPGGAQRKNGVRYIHDIDWYEYSPVLFGAAPLSGTLTVKSAQPVGDVSLAEHLALDPAEVKAGEPLKPGKCKFCDDPATKGLVWADGRSVIKVCGSHEAMARRIIKQQDDEVTEVRAVGQSKDAEGTGAGEQRDDNATTGVESAEGDTPATTLRPTDEQTADDAGDGVEPVDETETAGNEAVEPQDETGQPPADTVDAPGDRDVDWADLDTLAEQVTDDDVTAVDDALVGAGVKASRASLNRKPGKNWVENTGELPGYIREVARAIERGGTPLERAIPIAIGTIRRWATGGGDVDADTRAKAQAALAAWERLKAKAGGTKTATLDGDGKIDGGEQGGPYEEHLAAVADAVLATLAVDGWDLAEVNATFPDRVVATRYRTSGDSPGAESYEVGYEVGEDGTVTLADEREPVRLSIATDGGEEPLDASGAVPVMVESAAETVKTLLAAAGEEKAGRVLSGANATRLRSAVEHLVAVLAAAGVRIDAAGAAERGEQGDTGQEPTQDEPVPTQVKDEPVAAAAEVKEAPVAGDVPRDPVAAAAYYREFLASRQTQD